MAGDAGRGDGEAGGKNGAAEIEPGLIGERQVAVVGVNRDDVLVKEADAFGAQGFIGEAEDLGIAQAGDHGVAGGAGGKDRVGLDEEDIGGRREALQGARRRGPAEAAADDDDAGLGLCAGDAGERQGSRDDGAAGDHCCPAHQAAIDLSSPGEKPLARRSITVAGRVPAR